MNVLIYKDNKFILGIKYKRTFFKIHLMIEKDKIRDNLPHTIRIISIFFRKVAKLYNYHHGIVNWNTIKMSI